MIRVCMLREGGRLVGFNASGHAGFAAGDREDIVCSAVSALTQTAVLGLQERVKLPLSLSIDEDEGISLLIGRGAAKAQRRDAQLILDTLLLGLQSIERGYSGYINIIEREV